MDGSSVPRKSSAKKLKFRFDETEPRSLAGRYMRRFWQPICLSVDLKPGKAKPIHALGESFTLYRGQSGVVHLSEFRCPHRGAQLSVGWVEGEDIRCMYHGWKFAADGRCLEQPGEVRGNFAHKVSIRTYPVLEYLGLVFGYFGPGEPPPLPRYSTFENGGYVDTSMYIRECNYFQTIENGMDEVHVNFTHGYTSFQSSGLNDEVPVIEAKETSYGLVEYAIRSGNRVRETHLLMPNILFLKLPPELPGEGAWRDYVSWRVPINHHVHVSFIVNRISLSGEHLAALQRSRQQAEERLKKLQPLRDVARKILAGEISMDEVLDREDLVGIQDSVTQIGQGAVADREKERLGQADVAIILLRKLWERELRKLAKDEPLTQWQVPDGLASTIGL